MDRSTLVAQITDTHLSRMALMTGKSEDYAGEDTLANFKRMHIISGQLGINPSRSAFDCAMFLVMLKIDRLMNLKRKGADPKNESVKDTILDLLNYIDLAFACESEKEDG